MFEYIKFNLNLLLSLFFNLLNLLNMVKCDNIYEEGSFTDLSGDVVYYNY